MFCPFNLALFCWSTVEIGLWRWRHHSHAHTRHVLISNHFLLSHHHSTSALVSEILMSVLQTVQKNNRQITYGQTVQKTALEHLQCSRQCKKTTTAIYIWTDSAKNCTGAFTVLQTVQKKKQQQQFTYGQTVQKSNSNLHMDSTYLQTVQKTMCKIHIHILSYVWVYVCIHICQLCMSKSYDFAPVKLSTFQAQALLAWKLIYKNNFSPLRYFIWNNRCILYKQKSIFLKNWFDKGIVLVSHLFNTQGYLMTYEEFLVHFNFPVTPKEFSLVFSAINSCVVSLFRDVKLVDMPIVNLYNMW